MHDYHESKTVLTINDNHEFKAENVLDNWNDNLQSLNQEKNEASVPVFYADWASVSVPQTSSLRGLDVGFIPPLPKKLPYMANNDEYTDGIDVVNFAEVIIPDIRISSSLTPSLPQ